MAPPCGGDARKDQSLKTPTPKAKLPRSDSMPTGTKVDKKTESKRLREEGEAILDRLEPQLKRRGHLQDDDKSKSPSDAKVEKSRQQGKATAVKAKAAPNPKSRQADDGDDANKTKQAAGSRNAKSQASNGTEKQSQESELQPKVANNTPRELSKPKTACKQAKKSESSSDDDDTQTASPKHSKCKTTAQKGWAVRTFQGCACCPEPPEHHIWHWQCKQEHRIWHSQCKQKQEQNFTSTTRQPTTPRHWRWELRRRGRRRTREKNSPWTCQEGRSCQVYEILQVSEKHLAFKMG